jgi:hypothetical protein
MQLTAEQFEERIGCRLLFSTVADGSGSNGPMREGRIEELSPNREWVLIGYNPEYTFMETDAGAIVKTVIERHNNVGWFRCTGLDVLDIWEKGKAK